MPGNAGMRFQKTTPTLGSALLHAASGGLWWPTVASGSQRLGGQLPLPVAKRRCFTALASVSRMVSESSQPMQASVTDWP